jgi:hypothetical protein
MQYLFGFASPFPAVAHTVPPMPALSEDSSRAQSSEQAPPAFDLRGPPLRRGLLVVSARSNHKRDGRRRYTELRGELSLGAYGSAQRLPGQEAVIGRKDLADLSMCERTGSPDSALKRRGSPSPSERTRARRRAPEGALGFALASHNRPRSENEKACAPPITK